MKLIPFRGKTPQIADDAFIAPGAVLIGDVHIASGVSVWYNAVIRADHETIHIGANSNLQDGAVVHSATIDDGALIGMNATVLNGAHIGAGSVVGANALVTERAEFEPDSLILGVPARAVGQVKPEMREWIVKNCAEYVTLGAEYAAADTDTND